MALTEQEYKKIKFNEDRIATKLHSYFPSTVGANGKMLRPLVKVTYESGTQEYKVSVVYEEQEY